MEGALHGPHGGGSNHVNMVPGVSCEDWQKLGCGSIEVFWWLEDLNRAQGY